MNLPRFALRNRTITMTAVVLAFLWGYQVYQTMPRNEDPTFVVRIAIIVTQWPGANANKVEELLTIPIERSISSITEVRRVWSYSQIGMSIVYVELDKNIYETEKVWNKLRGKINKLAPTLPREASTPTIDTEFGSTDAMLVALYPLYPEKYTYEDLRKIAKDMESELNTIPMMGRIQIVGVQDEVINLEISPGVWSKLKLTTDQLQHALNEKNITAPGGTIDTRMGRFSVTPSGEFETTKQIENLVLGSVKDRAPTYLKNLGIKVSRTYRSPRPNFCRYIEKDFVAEKCLVVSFTMKKGGNIVELGKIAHEKLREIRTKKIIPGDIAMGIVADQPHHVERSIDSFTGTLMQGIFVVVIVGLLLIGIRISLIMALSIPTIMVISLGIVRSFGVELEQVSIAALVVAIGMLVDNAIEVSENIHRRMCEGEPPFEAAWRGASEIAVPILSATLTTVAAFLPMLTIPGGTGEFVYGLPVVISTTLLVSWLVAVTSTTVLCYWFIKPTAVQGGVLAFIVRCWVAMIAVVSRLRGGQGEVISFSRRLWKWVRGQVPIDPEGHERGVIKNRYAALLTLCLRHRYITLSAGVGLFILSNILPNFIGSQFFPLAFRDQFVVDIWLPKRAPLSRVDEVCRQVERIIREKSRTKVDGKTVNRLQSLGSFVGGGTPRFYVGFEVQPKLHYLAQIVVNTTDPIHTDTYIRDIRPEIERKIAGARITVRKLALGVTADAPLALRIVGKDTGQMRKFADKVKKYLYRRHEVLSVYDDWGPPVFQLDIKIDEDLANVANVTNRNVATTMNTFLDGQFLTTFREGDHTIPVYLRLPEEDRSHLANLYNFYIDGQNSRVPLDGIAEMKISHINSTIARRDQERTITVFGFVDEDYLPNDVLTAILPDLRKIAEEMPPGYRLNIGGEWEASQDSQGDFAIAFTISLILIILILVSQYNGLTKPFMIMLTLPMAFVGGMVGLIITDLPLNFMAQLGMISLAGIVVNNAIVFIDFADKQLLKGLPIEEALVKTGCMRLVPIMLTSMTTAGGLIPLALWGGPLFEPMAYVIIFGLMVATMLTLVIIPALYMTLYKDFKIALVEVEPAKLEESYGLVDD